MRIPARGEVWSINLNPIIGQEQQGTRPILILSEKVFNKMGLILTCLITQGGNQARFAGFAVSLMGTGMKTQGIVMCNQSRTLDYQSRRAEFIEIAPDYIIDDVLARVRAILT